MNDKEWFESWFDTSYYHLLYNHRDEKEAEKFISNLLQLLQLPKGSAVLDAACGKGRHAKFFSCQGLETTGFDLSVNSILEAKKLENEHLKFEVWDIRKVFQKNSFDLVTNLFSSFGYFKEEENDQLAISAMANSVKAGGTFVMDYMNGEKIIKLLKPREIIDKGDIQFHIQKKLVNGFIQKKIEFLADGEDHQYEENLKIIKPEQFNKLFANAGLEITHRFGDYDLNPFNAAESMRQIMIAVKK
jgi:SAM-dependent methyltransferase